MKHIEKKYLSSFIDQELSEVLFDQVKKHLQSCEKCQKELDEMEKITNEIRSHCVLNQTPALYESVINKIQTNTNPWMMYYMLSKRIASGFAVYILILFVAITLGLSAGNDFQEKKEKLPENKRSMIDIVVEDNFSEDFPQGSFTNIFISMLDE